MKAIKPPKQPNPIGRPLPSRFARTFYKALKGPRWVHGLKNRPCFSLPSGTVLNDRYGSAYRVGSHGELLKAG